MLPAQDSRIGAKPQKGFEMIESKNVTAETTNDGGNREPREATELSLLIDVHDVAALLKCSARHIWRMADAGKMPRPHKIGALCRWDRAVIEQWVADGCPSCRKAAR